MFPASRIWYAAINIGNGQGVPTLDGWLCAKWIYFTILVKYLIIFSHTMNNNNVSLETFFYRNSKRIVFSTGFLTKRGLVYISINKTHINWGSPNGDKNSEIEESFILHFDMLIVILIYLKIILISRQSWFA